MRKYVIAGLLAFFNALELGLMLAASSKESVQAVLIFAFICSLLITGLCVFAVYVVLTDRAKAQRKRKRIQEKNVIRTFR